MLEEKLEALAAVLDVPEEIEGCSLGEVALQFHRVSFRHGDVGVRLDHPLGYSGFCKSKTAVSSGLPAPCQVCPLRSDSENRV